MDISSLQTYSACLSILLTVLLLSPATVHAQECTRTYDEFDQQSEIDCESVEFESPDRRIFDLSAYWREGPDFYGVSVLIEAGYALYDYIRADEADLIVDEWRGAVRVDPDPEAGEFVSVSLPLDDDLVRRVARADTFRIRIHHRPYNISRVIPQVARVLEMTSDVSFPDIPKSDDTQSQTTTIDYAIQGLSRDPRSAPLPEVSGKVDTLVEADITVSPRGKVVRVETSDTGDSELTGAVRDALTRWRFPLEVGENETGRVVFTFRSETDRKSDQETEETTGTESQENGQSDDELFVVVEDQPELIGGMEALNEEAKYPDDARQTGIEGVVYVSFVVDKDGNVQNPEVTRGLHKLLNEEAVRAVKEMKFKPGMQRGNAVKVQMSLPVTFRLQ